MKVVAAIDSFKGSMTSMEAGNAVKKGILAAKPDAEVWLSPLADGGEGTVDALIEGLGAEKIPVTVAGPLGEKVSCYYGFLEETKTAVMEMASAAGITLVIKKDPLRASTYGVGEMIADALKRGCKNFMIGIGGSATNDGGIGMLKALGFEFFDEDGNDVGEGAAALAKIEVIRTENKNSLLSGAKFQIACDVKNPLCGKQGATYIFGPQKGVTEEQKSKVDEAMKHYADVTKESLEQAEDKERQAKGQEDQCNKDYVAALQDCKNRIGSLLEQIEIWDPDSAWLLAYQKAYQDMSVSDQDNLFVKEVQAYEKQKDEQSSKQRKEVFQQGQPERTASKDQPDEALSKEHKRSTGKRKDNLLAYHSSQRTTDRADPNTKRKEQCIRTASSKERKAVA